MHADLILGEEKMVSAPLALTLARSLNPTQISDTWQISCKSHPSLRRNSSNSQTYLRQTSRKIQANMTLISGKSQTYLGLIKVKSHSNLRHKSSYQAYLSTILILFYRLTVVQSSYLFLHQ